jgi:lipoprotein NlpI
MKRRFVRACIALACLCPLVATAQGLPQPSPAAPAANPTAATPIRADREVEIAADAFAKDPATPKWVEPHAIVDSKAAGPVVVELGDTQVMIGERTVTYAHRAIKINDQVALTPLGRLPLLFIPDYQRLVLHTFQLIRDGVVLDRLADAKVRFLQQETGLSNYMYSGIVTASILIDDLRVGDTLEVAYSLIGTNPVFGNRFGAAENWDQPLPTAYRRVIVNAPVDRPVRWRFHGDLSTKFPAPTEHIHNGIRTLTFDEHDVVAIPQEPGVPQGFNTYRWLQLSEYDSWQSVATWAAGLFEVHEEAPSPERRALVATLMAMPTVEERIVGALEFVQSQVRYFSVSLGTSSHQPTAPNIVMTRRYGDCKDKSLLLFTLLKDMGIPSTPVLARLGNRSGFDDWLPTPLAFDHVIVAVDVDGAHYFLDSTRLGQHGKLARMGQAHDGAQVLPAATVGGMLTRIVVPNRDELVRDDRTESLVVEKLDGDGVLTATETLTGVGAENLRVGFGAVTKERYDTGVTSDMEKRYAGAKLLEPVRIDDDREDNRFKITARFTLPKPVTHANGQYRVVFRADNLARIFTVPQEAKRRAPIVLRFPVTATYRFDATFPDEVAVTLDPRAESVDSRYFKSTASRSFLGNHSESAIEIRTLSDRVAAADLQLLKDDLQKFARTYPSGVLVADSEIKKPVFLGLGKKDFATSLKDRQEDLVKRVSTTITGGKLTGADLARAYCTRAYAYAALGKGDDALKDGDHAIEAEADNAASLLCRATLRTQFKQFDGAIEDASQAIVFGSDTGRPWQIRGQARFYQGRYAEAAADFAKAATMDHDDRVNVMHDLWRALSYRRMKKPLPDDLQKRAAEAPRGDWPRPVLAMFADRLTPDEVTTLAASKSGDEASMIGTEADFYIGEFYLTNDDATKARESFTAARARGVIIYIEYGAAAIELDRLGAAAH